MKLVSTSPLYLSHTLRPVQFSYTKRQKDALPVAPVAAPSVLTVLKHTAVCVGASIVGHSLLGNFAHHVSEMIEPFLGHGAHNVIESLMCCGVPSGLVEGIPLLRAKVKRRKAEKATLKLKAQGIQLSLFP